MEAKMKEKAEAAAKADAAKNSDTENEYTKIVDYQPIPTDDDSVRGVYRAFELSQQPKPAPKPLPPPPKIISHQERLYNNV